MKKRLIGIMSFVLALFMSIACFSGCNLVTTDSNKEMNQVIATVSIDENFNDEIYKSDLVVTYLNGGYLNETYYGYTRSQNIEVLVSGLVNQRIIIQNAYKTFEADDSFVKNTAYDVYNPLRYMSDEEVTDAQYQAYYSVNALFEGYQEAEAATNKDTVVGDVRTVPTNASNDAKERTVAEKVAYINKGFDYSDKQAVRSAASMLDQNGLLGDKYKETGKFEDTEYFKRLLEDYYEDAIVEIYEERLALEARRMVTYEALAEAYVKMHDSQTTWNNADFVSNLSSASASDPIVYSGYGSYGYVYNLLIGVSDEQKAEIEAIREDNANISDDDYAAARKTILASTVAEDLRSSWILSGYDAKEIEVSGGNQLVFTGDYTFAKDERNSLPFKGSYAKIKDADEEKRTDAEYSVTGVTSFGFASFVDMMNEYIAAGSSSDNSAEYASVGADNIYGAKKLSNVEEYEAKISELLFAFSTDSGSLNTYKGYVIKPEVDGSNTEEYVTTFANAGRILLQQGSGYVIVASDYGYHVLFYSELLKINTAYATLEGYLDSLDIDKPSTQTWKEYYEEMLSDYEAFEETDSYLFKLADVEISVKTQNYQNQELNALINKYTYTEKNCVKVYKDVYSDLANA